MRRATAWCAAVVLLAAAGCARPGGAERYVPEEPAARQALEAALRAWQAGDPGPRIDSVVPPVMVCDSIRRPGQSLRDFEILGEVPGDGPRQFAVRLVLDDPPEEQKVRFVVFGISPLWVYRLEDYEMLLHWECGMTTEKETGREPGSAPARGAR